MSGAMGGDGEGRTEECVDFAFCFGLEGERSSHCRLV